LGEHKVNKGLLFGVEARADGGFGRGGAGETGDGGEGVDSV